MKAHIFAAIAVFALPLTGEPLITDATAEPQNRQRARERDNMRFRGMDTNNDGRITRDEWRGNDRAFRNNDWNNDGVLSGPEVRQNAQRNDTGWRDIDDDDEDYRYEVERFEELDRNRNGRIERREWNGTREAFEWLDRNNDGALSRSETVGNDTRARNDDRWGDARNDDRRGEMTGNDTTFEGLDRDRSGYIERDEWPHARRNFEARDRNQDGRLTREEAGNLYATGSAGSYERENFGREETIVINPRVRWTDTGIELRPGDVVSLRADGVIVLSGNANGNDRANVSGSLNGRRADNAPLPMMPAGGLIARIGNSAPFYVGNRETIDRVNASGRLYLGVNDDELGDNHGEFRVRLRTTR